MGRFTKGRELLSGRAKHSQALTDTPFPVTEDSEPYRGSFIITESGEMQWSNGEEWIPLSPPGIEVMIPPWIDVPEGWFEISGRLGGDFENRRIIANKFDFAYVEDGIISWMLPVAANMWETSSKLTQVSSPPSPVGYLIDTTLPSVDWTQPVSGNRPVWGQVTRFAQGQDRTIDQITFNRVGQAFELGIPAAIEGTMMVATSKGIYALGVYIPSGTYTYGRWDHLPVEEILISTKFLTNTEIEAFKDFLVENRFRIKDEFGDITDFSNAWRGRSDIISFPLLDTSGATDMGRETGTGESDGAWRDCVNMPTFPLIDTSSVQFMRGTWRGCSSLTSFPLIDTSSVIDMGEAWMDCSALESFPLIDTSSVVTLGATWGNRFNGAWKNCTSLTQFPTIDTGNVVFFNHAWEGCTGLTNFPTLDTSSARHLIGTWQGCSAMSNEPGHPTINSFPAINTTNVEKLGNSKVANSHGAWKDCTAFTVFPLLNLSNCVDFSFAWQNCSGLSSFPSIDTSSGTSFMGTWKGCTGLSVFPSLDISSGTIFGQRINNNIAGAWRGCTGLTSFPTLDFGNAISISGAWEGCTGLTSFPLIDTSLCESFEAAWAGCTSLTSFSPIDTSAGTNFSYAWYNCTSLTSFPLIDTSAGTNFSRAWYNCTSLTSFPANAFDNVSGGNFTGAFTNTALTQTSIDNILVSLVASGIAAGTRVFNQSGGSAPSAAGEAAIDTLRSRGWTVTVTGGY